MVCSRTKREHGFPRELASRRATEPTPRALLDGRQQEWPPTAAEAAERHHRAVAAGAPPRRGRRQARHRTGLVAPTSQRRGPPKRRREERPAPPRSGPSGPDRARVAASPPPPCRRSTTRCAVAPRQTSPPADAGQAPPHVAPQEGAPSRSRVHRELSLPPLWRKGPPPPRRGRRQRRRRGRREERVLAARVWGRPGAALERHGSELVLMLATSVFAIVALFTLLH